MKSEARVGRSRSRWQAWWVIWGAMFGTLAVSYLVLGGKPLRPRVAAEPDLASLAALLPLFISIVIRWLVLPRSRELRRAFILFLAGLTLAELGGFLGLFLGGPYRDELFVLGLLGLAQFMPLFGAQFAGPRPTGFMPNR